MRKLSIYVLMAAMALLTGAADASVAVNAVTKGKPDRSVNCDPNADGCLRDLVAGQHTVVGTVSVVEADGSLLVTYDTSGSDWWLTEIHFEVSGDPISNPAPGQFGFKPTLDAPTQFFQFNVEPPTESDVCGNEGKGYFYAAHAVVEEAIDSSYVDLSLPALPETVQFKLASSSDSYVSTTVLDSDFFGDSPYEGWCIDEDRTIFLGQVYTAKVYSSYEQLPEGAVDNPEMLDEVNWIINQNLVGQASLYCDGSDDETGPTYSDSDVQQAIWYLLEDELKFIPTCKVSEIADAALANGNGFEPECGETIAVVLVPVNTATHEPLNAQVTIITAQVTVISTETDCQPIFGGMEETAWACGDFIRPGKNWAMSFQCCASGPAVN
jgi:hypothetical protein